MNRSPKRRLATQIAIILAAFLGWNALMGGALLLLPRVYAILAAALLFAWFLRAFVLRSGRPGERRRWALLRIRPLGRGAARATLASIPVLFALSWSVGELWVRLVPVPPETLQPFRQLTGDPLGRLSVTLVAVVAAPLLEELVFRGMIQHPLERRWGPGRAIALTSLVFAAFHFLPWVLPVHLVLGLAFGYAVYATRSIWAGVALHAANNSMAALALGAETPELPPTIWRTGITSEFWTALAVLAAAAVAARHAAEWLWRAGHAARLAERGRRTS
ncbi:MAG TPA: type II CAAX endopeptidase family protein [Longimicrobiaceae bacterium]|nr:type II CAAX endopeptidase family protein [Longimicrobiaceae bacterium]